MEWVKCVVVALLTGFPTAGFAESRTDAKAPITLETLRRQVANNERLIDPIKLNYTVSISRTGERPQPAAGMRRRGRSYSHYDVVWAQSGGRQCVRMQYFYGPNEPGRSGIKVLGSGLRTYAERPERISIGPVRNTDWRDALPAKLCLRPFEDHGLLSEVLVRPHATLLPNREVVDGRATWVVDITRPEYGASVERFWIGVDSGLPLRICLYEGHPDGPDARLAAEVNDITPHRLPNGGWIPVSGVRVIHAEGLGGCERVAVDVNSITIRPDDVPDSLFRLNPPEGGSVYNVFTCLTTVRGSELKTYEQIVKGPGTCVSGVVVDAEGAPVARTVVVPFGITTAQIHKLIQPFERICSVTDGQGRFALELEEEGRYDLQFYSAEFVDEESRDVLLGEHDLKIVLDRGGVVTGRVFFMAGGRKAPLAGVSVRAQAGDRLMDIRMRSVRRETLTDHEGRFEFKCLPTRMRDRSIASSEPPRYVPLPWQISCGSTSESILFKGDGDRREVELVLQPDVRSAPPLVGRSLPDLAGLGLDVAADKAKGCKLLICFFDMEQRPARNCVEELAKRAATLKDQGVSVFAIAERGVGSDKLQAWAKEAGVAFPLGITAGDPAEVRFAWAARSLPWLILTDENHVVVAEGFGLDELNAKIGAIESTTK